MPEKDNQKDANSTGEPDSSGEMSLLTHLDELRKRIIVALVGLLVGCIIAAVFIEKLLDYVLLLPAATAHLDLQNLKPFGQPFLYFKVILVAGIIISFPFILFQLWRFVAPALYRNERRWARKITFFTSVCFLSGVAFSYFVMLPLMMKFAASFGSDKIKNIIDINEYFSFITMILLAAGLLFELPTVAYILSRIGILTPRFMRRYRRHAIILILIVAAVLTPTPDPVTQLIFAVPLFFLYEISIIIAKFAQRKYDIAGKQL